MRNSAAPRRRGVATPSRDLDLQPFGHSGERRSLYPLAPHEASGTVARASAAARGESQRILDGKLSYGRAATRRPSRSRVGRSRGRRRAKERQGRGSTFEFQLPDRVVEASWCGEFPGDFHGLDAGETRHSREDLRRPLEPVVFTTRRSRDSSGLRNGEHTTWRTRLEPHAPPRSTSATYVVWTSPLRIVIEAGGSPPRPRLTEQRSSTSRRNECWYAAQCSRSTARRSHSPSRCDKCAPRTVTDRLVPCL